MKRIFFLPNALSYLLAFVLLYVYSNYGFGYNLLASLIIFAVFYNFRKSNIPFRDTLKNDGEIYLSPIHGTVESIRRNISHENEEELLHEVRISMSLLDEKGLYLPTSGEVSYLKANVGKRIPRNSSPLDFDTPMGEVEHTDFILTSKNQLKTLLRFIDCTYSKRPKIWLKSGDRGRGAACFGFYPFGGTLVIYLPGNSDILVFEKEKVVPGLTVIAAIKDVTQGINYVDR